MVKRGGEEKHKKRPPHVTGGGLGLFGGRFGFFLHGSGEAAPVVVGVAVVEVRLFSEALEEVAGVDEGLLFGIHDVSPFEG